MTATLFTTHDLMVIAQWAHAPWRLARSLRWGVNPDRPELEGGSLRATFFPDIETEFPDAWYEGSHKNLGIHTYRLANGHHQRDHLHTVTWTTVERWLHRWTRTDIEHLVTFDQERRGIEHTPEELDYNPTRTTAEHQEISRRRHERLTNGGYQRLHEIHQEQTELIRDHLTGARSPAQQEALF